MTNPCSLHYCVRKCWSNALHVRYVVHYDLLLQTFTSATNLVQTRATTVNITDWPRMWLQKELNIPTTLSTLILGEFNTVRCRLNNVIRWLSLERSEWSHNLCSLQRLMYFAGRGWAPFQRTTWILAATTNTSLWRSASLFITARASSTTHRSVDLYRLNNLRVYIFCWGALLRCTELLKVYTSVKQV